MNQVVAVGLDIAKSVFQLHGVDAQGAVVLRKRLTRARVRAFFEKLPPCLVGMEACGSSHYWGRELSALGHDVRLIPPSYVKPYVKRQKNDAADAEAICEAVTRPNMRFVAIKSPEQQAVMIAHRTRSILTRQRTQLSNAIRGHMAEFGLIAPPGRIGIGIARRHHRQRQRCSPASSGKGILPDVDCTAAARERADPGLRSPDHRQRAKHGRWSPAHEHPGRGVSAWRPLRQAVTELSNPRRG